MVDMDNWCPNCGYSVDPGTRFCGGCGHQVGGHQVAGQPGAPVAQESTVSMQAPAGPFNRYQAHGGSPLSAPVAPPAPLTPPPPAPGPPPPPSGSPLPYPPPPGGPPAPGPPAPGGYPGAPGAPGAEVSDVSDTVDRMLRPQGLFHNLQPSPADWQPPPPPAAAPGGYPGGQYPATGGFPQAAPYPPGGQYPGGPYPGGQYPQGPAGPPQAWPGAPLAPGGPAGYAGPYPNGQQQPPPPGAPYPNGQYPNGQYPNGQYANGQYGPDGMPLPGGAGGPAGGAGGPGLLDRLRARRPKGPLLPITVAAALVVIVVAALLLSAQGSPPSTAGSGTPTAAGPSASTSASGSAGLTQHQAASALSALLAQSGTDHSDVNAAVTNVESCKGLSADARTFNKAAANRRTLLGKLAGLPGRSALSAAMLANLTGAWQASATVDSDLAKWAADGIGHCKKNNFKDPHYSATLPFDSKATNDKAAFVKEWNSLAKKYGLPSYSSSQI